MCLGADVTQMARIWQIFGPNVSALRQQCRHQPFAAVVIHFLHADAFKRGRVVGWPIFPVELKSGNSQRLLAALYSGYRMSLILLLAG
jgi:hypothetical protein